VAPPAGSADTSHAYLRVEHGFRDRHDRLRRCPPLRLVGLWALGFVPDPGDVELLAAAASDADPRVRFAAIGSIPDPAGNDDEFRALRVCWMSTGVAGELWVHLSWLRFVVLS
jgi:hypothetical protein